MLSSVKKINWDTHILVVYSVLAGLSLAQCFDTLTASSFDPTKAILLSAVFYIVFDNWYCLHVRLRLYDIERPIEVVFYLIAIVFYSCLPFLYAAKNLTSVASLSFPEFLLINLSIICLFDAISKHATLTRLCRISKQPSTKEQITLVGTFVFYTTTGYIYFVLLLFVIWLLKNSSLSSTWKAALVVVLWFAVRTIDRLVIPRASGYLAGLIMSSAPTVEDVNVSDDE